MLKTLFVLLKVFKLGKIGGTGISMLISLVAYALVFGWRYAAGFIALLMMHEMGHFIAARQRGLDVGAPTFIPFVGAWIELKEGLPDVETEAHVALCGPLLGTFAAIVVYYWGLSTDSKLLLAIAYSGFVMNFFNLIPLSPLDGGRITAILTPRIWLIGAPLMLALMFYRPSPLLILIALMSWPSLVAAWKYDPHAPENQAYYDVPLAKKWEYGLLYLGLAAYLGVMSSHTHDMLGTVR